MEFCTNCGAQIEGGAFCANCGAPVAAPAPDTTGAGNESTVSANPVNEQPVNEQPANAQPVNEQPVNEQPVNEQPVNAQPAYAAPDNTGYPEAPKGEGMGKRILAGIIAAIIILGAIFVIRPVFQKMSPKSVVKAYVQSHINYANKTRKLMPPKYIKEQELNKRITFKITDVDSIKDDDLDAIKDYFEKKEWGKVKAAKYIEVKYKQGDDESTDKIRTVKIGGSWYVYEGFIE